MPAAKIPHAITSPAPRSLRNPRSRAASIAAINVRLSTTETSELSTNLPNVFRTPDSSATSDMHSRYGKAMRDISTARSNFSTVSAKPGARTYISHGMPIMHRADRKMRMNVSPAIPSSAKARAASRPSPSSFLAKRGTKAALNAPSPNQRRKRFGKRKATTKASATNPVPKTAASRISRKNPRTRLTIVSPPTVAKAR